MKKKIIIRSENRTCEGCTACCEGWLAGEVYGHKFWQGRKCHFLRNSNCSIYAERPKDPCQNFQCKWLVDGSLPEWMKPSESKVIIIEKEIKDYKYWQVVEAGQKMDSSVLSWIFTQIFEGRITNLQYQIDSGWNTIGTEEFMKEINKTT